MVAIRPRGPIMVALPFQHPFLVTLGMDPESFDRLDRLRTRYFPPERNVVPAHLTLLHYLPGEEWEEVDTRLRGVAAEVGPIPLMFHGVKRTSNGMKADVHGIGLAYLRARLLVKFHRWLTPQDMKYTEPHVMLMNKADKEAAVVAYRELSTAWQPWGGEADRIQLWRYLNGPWEAVEDYPLVGDISKRLSAGEGER